MKSEGNFKYLVSDKKKIRKVWRVFGSIVSMPSHLVELIFWETDLFQYSSSGDKHVLFTFSIAAIFWSKQFSPWVKPSRAISLITLVLWLYGDKTMAIHFDSTNMYWNWNMAEAFWGSLSKWKRFPVFKMQLVFFLNCLEVQPSLLWVR